MQERLRLIGCSQLGKQASFRRLATRELVRFLQAVVARLQLGAGVTPDTRYALARTVLPDALEALGDQSGAVIVVGADWRAEALRGGQTVTSARLIRSS